MSMYQILPPWSMVFILFALLLAAATEAAKDMFPKVDREKERLDSIELAKRIASNKQYTVKAQRSKRGNVVVLDTCSMGEEMDEFQLTFKKTHPDFELLSLATPSTVIRFRFEETPEKGVNAQDAVAYLRISTIAFDSL